MELGWKAVGLLAMGILGMNTAQANLIVNGNFASGTTTGWTFTGYVGLVPYANYSAFGGNMNGTWAGSPNGVVYGGGNMPATGVISQTIATVAGNAYSVTFDYGSFSTTPPSGSQSLKVRATDGQTSAVLFTNTASTTVSSNSLNTLYTIFPTYTFAATGSSTVLSFADVSTYTVGIDGFLTNISVVSAVPEPTGWSLILSGLASFVLVVRRRQPEMPEWNEGMI